MQSKIIFKNFILVIFLLLLLVYHNSIANESEANENEIKKNEVKVNKIQRVVQEVDSRFNTLGNLHFIVNNYGQIGFDIRNNRASFLWQNDSTNLKSEAKVNYIYGSGVLFSGKKREKLDDGKSKLKNYVVTTFDINENKISTIQGRLEDGNELATNKLLENQVFLSTQYDENGRHIFDISEPYYPLRTINKNIFGSYIYDNNDRKNIGRAAIVSDEDLFTSYKIAAPLSLQFETTLHTWDKKGKNPELSDIVLINTVITNKSNDTLFECNFGNITDIDITQADKLYLGENNDKLKLLKYKSNGLTYENDYILLCYTDSSKTDIIDLNSKNNARYGYLFGKIIYHTPIQNNRVLQENPNFINDPNFPKIRRDNVRTWNCGLISVEDDIYPSYKDGKIHNYDNFYNYINTSNFNSTEKANKEYSTDVRTFAVGEKFDLYPNESVRMIYVWGLASSTIEHNLTYNLIPKPKNNDFGEVFTKIDAIYDKLEDITSSIKESQITFSNSNNVKIYPNPAINEIDVFLDLNFDKHLNNKYINKDLDKSQIENWNEIYKDNFSYRIYNSNGEVIANTKLFYKNVNLNDLNNTQEKQDNSIDNNKDNYQYFEDWDIDSDEMILAKTENLHKRKIKFKVNLNTYTNGNYFIVIDGKYSQKFVVSK